MATDARQCDTADVILSPTRIWQASLQKKKKVAAIDFPAFNSPPLPKSHNRLQPSTRPPSKRSITARANPSASFTIRKLALKLFIISTQTLTLPSPLPLPPESGPVNQSIGRIVAKLIDYLKKKMLLIICLVAVKRRRW